MIKIGAFPAQPVINAATRTLYVSYGDTGNRVAVVNAATCNATDTSGCGQTPAVAKIRPFDFFGLAVSEATNTIYAPNTGPGFSGDTMSVINGATCNGTDHSGCGRLAPTVKVGLGPSGVAVNDRTRTVYVVNSTAPIAHDSPGRRAPGSTMTCNGTNSLRLVRLRPGTEGVGCCCWRWS